MSKYLLLLYSVLLFSLWFLVSNAFSSEQCVARFEPSTGIARIPCLKIGDQEIWVNLRLSSSHEVRLELDRLGENFLPDWLTEKIRKFEEASVTNPPRWITQYRYKDSIVYYVSSPCCDQFNYLYDYDGNIICAPDGGFTGKGDGRCTDYFEQKTDRVVVWEDARDW